MRKKIAIAFICLFIFIGILKAQVAVNTSSSAAHSSAIFDVSSTTKGMLIPRMTSSEMQTIGSPAPGLLVYNTTVQAIYQYSGTAWTMLKASNPAKLQDADGNTTVDAEFAPNNDKIYFRLGGNTKMILNSTRLEFLDANHNLFFGPNAGQINNSGSYNIAIGESALSAMGNMTNNNVAIGYQALMNSNTFCFGNTAIGYKALMTNESNLNTGIGSEALQNNTNGVGNTAIGAWTLVANGSSNNNTALGTSSLNHNTAPDNTALGNSALYLNTTGFQNSVIGSNSMYNNVSGSNNTAAGYKALYLNNDGSQNTAIGSNSLYNNFGGHNNIAVGYVTMINNQSGNENTAVGTASLYNNVTGHNNSAFGREALLNNTTSDNTAIGFHAAHVTSSGFQNVAVGSNSLVNNTTGSYHTAIGYNTGPNASNLANTTTLGIDARATATDMVRIGNGFVNSIGGIVDWTTFSDGRFKENVREDVPGLSFINQLRPVTYNVNRSGFNEFVGLSGSTLASDAAYSSKPLSERTTGFIAQEVEASAQSMGFDFSGVDAPDNPDDYYGLRYAEFVVPLVKAVQELSAQNAAQQKMIEELERKVEALDGIVSPQ
jgi:hypothetical protein